MRKCIAIVVCMGLLWCSLAGCASKEEKKVKFYTKGKDLYEQALYVKAGLELKNALQLDPEYTDAWYLLGMTEEKQGNLKQAFGIFSKVITLNPDHIGSNVELGKIYQVAKMPDKAMEKAEFVLGKDPQNVDAAILKAGILMETGRPDEGFVILKQLLAKKITNPEVYVLLYRDALRRNDITGGEQTLKDGIRLNPESKELHLILANHYMKTGKSAEAEAALKNIIRLDPDKMVHKLNLASFYMATGKKEEGQGLINSVLQADPSSEENWLSAAVFYQQRNMQAEVEKTLKEGIAANRKGIKLRLALNELYMATGRVSQAIDLLNEYLTLDKDSGSPGVIQAKNALADCYLKKGEIDTAQKYVEEALKENPKDVNLHYTRGRIHLLRGEALDAVTDLRLVTSEMPRFIPGHLALAEAHRLGGENGLAVDTLKNAQKANPQSVEIAVALAKAYLNKGDEEEAVRTLRAAAPEHGEVHAYLGDIAARRGDMAGAEQEYRELLRKDQGMPGYTKLVQLYLLSRKPEKAVLTAEEAYSANPDSIPALTLLVNTCLSQNRTEKAIAACDARLQKKPGDPAALYLMGRVYYTEKDTVKAAEYAYRAMKIYPVWAEPYLLYVRSSLALGKKDEAIRNIEELMRVNPKNPTPQFALGMLYEQSKDIARAVATYESALQRFPESWPIVNNLAYLLAEKPRSRADLEKALTLAQKAMTLNPSDSAVRDTLGWIYYRKGDNPRALRHIDMALGQDPLNPIFNYHKGTVLSASGEKARAMEYLNAALKSPAPFEERQEAEKLLRSLKG